MICLLLAIIVSAVVIAEYTYKRTFIKHYKEQNKQLRKTIEDLLFRLPNKEDKSMYNGIQRPVTMQRVAYGTAMWRCSHCGTMISTEGKSTPRQSGVKYCKKCGGEIVSEIDTTGEEISD